MPLLSIQHKDMDRGQSNLSPILLDFTRALQLIYATSATNRVGVAQIINLQPKTTGWYDVFHDCLNKRRGEPSAFLSVRNNS